MATFRPASRKTDPDLKPATASIAYLQAAASLVYLRAAVEILETPGGPSEDAALTAAKCIRWYLDQIVQGWDA